MYKICLTTIMVICVVAGASAADLDGVYKGPMTGSCRSGAIALTIADGKIVYHPGANEEGTAPIQPDGSFQLFMISNARYAGTRITIDGKVANGSITGQFDAAGSFRCVYTFSLSHQ